MATMRCPHCGGVGKVLSTHKTEDGKAVEIVVEFPCDHLASKTTQVEIVSPARMENTPAPAHRRTDY